MITKSFLRKVILQYRILIESITYSDRNERLCKMLIDFIEDKRARKIHTFLPIKKNNEPDVSSLLESLWSQEVKVVISQTDFLFKQMHHFYYDRETKLIENKIGIPEPINAKETTLDDLDMILIPLLVSDKEGFRIGYGGGYYDKLLAETKAMKVGLSLSPPVDKIMQAEDWDIPLNFLITPFKLYNYG